MRSRHEIGALRLALLGSILAAALLAPPALAAGPGGAPTAAQVTHLEAECARLRTDLDRANADIATLKRSDRGFRNDYRLRQRMADAEALARKLTAAEAQLRARKGPGIPARGGSLAPPSAEPGDGPVELEAKADLLSDQARRLSAEAEGLVRVAGQIRGRQTLRRRANQLDRDPFAGLDAAKRTMVFGAARGGGKSADDSTGPDSSNTGSKGPTTSTENATRGSGGAGSAPAMGGAAPAPAPTSQPPMAPPPQTAPPRATADNALTPPPGPAPQPTTALSTQLRTLLDPLTLSEVQRLERTGQPITHPEALEKLASALRQRAQSLDIQAKTLRAKARP